MNPKSSPYETHTPAIADKAFAKWLAQANDEPEVNENAKVIADALWDLI